MGDGRIDAFVDAWIDGWLDALMNGWDGIYRISIGRIQYNNRGIQSEISIARQLLAEGWGRRVCVGGSNQGVL